MRKFRVGAAVLLLSTVVAVAPTPAGAADPPATAGRAIPGQFIVTLRDGADARGVAAEYRRDGADIDHVYTAALNGFAGRMSDPAVRKARQDGRVLRVERDQVVTIDATTQENATWGLDRTDQRDRPLDGSYTYDSDGAGVRVYVLDTGIQADHSEFTGRLSPGADFVGDGRGTDDCNGHGTHVAGTIGGSVYGVAKKVTLVPVRVLNCRGSGSWSGVIAGVDWVTKNAIAPAVANMSLGGGAYSTLDDAVTKSVSSGVTYAVAAGNSDADACNYSPARARAALTVGATTSTDSRASYSNFGTCLDVFAPGSSITSAWHTSTTATNTISGTSMASPHVAGVAALLLGTSAATTPATVESALEGDATVGKVTSAGSGSPNLLLHSPVAAVAEPEPPGNVAPTAAFTSSCSGLTCSFTDGSTDGDGTIASRSWAFGDGASSTATNPSHTYAGGGTYTVTLAVTDDDGATTSSSQSVTVSAPSTGDPVTTITTSSTNHGSSWRALVTLTVSNAGGATTTLSGGWKGTSGPTSCQLNGDGSCTLTSDLIRKSVSSVQFNVTSPADEVGTRTVTKP